MSKSPAVGRPGGSPEGRIVVFRALQLGDMLCAVPALRALRAGFPGAEIVLIGLPWASILQERYPQYLDGFRAFPGYPGLPERTPEIGRIPGFLAEIQAERFDLAVQLHGSGRLTNPIVALLGARQVAGFCEPGVPCQIPGRFLPYPARGTEVRRLLDLIELLGLPARGTELEFPVWERDRRALRGLAESREFNSHDYVCVHPGASVPERRWPPGRFAEVADALAARGLGVVLTGTAGEADLTRAVGRKMRAPSVDLAGRTDLGTAAALIEGARLLVCNDTGVSHLAAALRVPSVVISTGDNPERWAPSDRRRHRVLCRDSGVAAPEVIAQAEDLLRERPVLAAS